MLGRPTEGACAGAFCLRASAQDPFAPHGGREAVFQCSKALKSNWVSFNVLWIFMPRAAKVT